jgi:hypothetical protein
VDDQRIETMLKIQNDPRPRAQRVVELLLREHKSDEDIEELSYLLFMFFDVGEFRKFLRYLKDYEMSEEEEAAEPALSKGMRELWFREHPEDRDRKMWTGEDDRRMRDLWEKSRN